MLFKEDVETQRRKFGSMPRNLARGTLSASIHHLKTD